MYLESKGNNFMFNNNNKNEIFYAYTYLSIHPLMLFILKEKYKAFLL